LTRYLFLLGLLSFGCMASRGVIRPDDYAPRSAASMYQIDMRVPKLEDRDEPAVLVELVDIALRNNPSTKLTWAKARAAAALWAQAQSADFPVLSGSYSIQRDRTSTVETSGTTGSGLSRSGTLIFVSQSTTWGPQLQLSYTLLDFGLTAANVRAAKEALLEADFTHNFQIQTVLNQVAADYYNYLSQQELLRAQEADLATAVLTEDVVKKEIEVGVKTISDLLQAQTTRLQTEINLTTQVQNVVNARAQLLTDVGLGAQSKLKIADQVEIPELDLMEQNVDAILAVALTKRADLLASEAALRSQEANVDAAWRQFLPNVTYNLTATHDRVKPGGNLGLNYTGILSVNFPIFSGFSTWNGLRQARAVRDQAKATLEQTQLTVVENVMTSYSAVKTALASLKLSDELLVVAEQQYTVALTRYKAGVGTIVELITAQNTLAAARSQNASSASNWLTSIVALSYAAGTLMPSPRGVQ